MSEFWVTIIGLVIGSIVKLQEQNMKNDQTRWDAVLKANQLEVEDRQNARKMQGPSVQFARRVLVFGLLGLLFSQVLWSFIFPEGAVNTPLTNQSGGLWAILTGGQEVIKYVKTFGFTVSPGLNHAFLLVIGYYFGSGGTK